jgi:hypothetical protein
LPLIWRVLPVTVQRCAALESHASMTTAVPLAVPLFSAARHLPAMPEVTAPVVDWAGVTARLSNWSVW